MKCDFSEPVRVGGLPVFIEREKEASLGDLCRQALNAPPSDHRLSLEELVERGRLALKIAAGGELEIMPEEAALIRKSLPDAFQHSEVVTTLYDMMSGCAG